MALTTTIVTILVLIASIGLLPAVTGYILRAILRIVGWSIENKTKARRESIWSRVRAEEEKLRKQRAKSASGSTEDEDWEKVESPPEEKTQNREPLTDGWEGIIGFFHPFCNAGGGGERVLWAAVKATQQRWPKAVCAIYTGDNITKETMLERVKTRFNIELHPPTVVLVYLSTRKYVLSSMYPVMTLLGQSLGSLIVAYDAFNLLVPDVYIDTMGYAFTVALCKYLFPNIPTGAYLHYPTISTDMLESLDDQSSTKGLNAGAGSGFRGAAKKKYWLWFARLYGWVGSKVDVVMTNSSWTSAHINALWGPWRKGLRHKEARVTFPPTAVLEMHSAIEVSAQTEAEREPNILYIAQFRPEKNHTLVLRAFARCLENHRRAQRNTPEPRLILIGSVRQGCTDETHIYNLRLLAHELRIREQTTFLFDANWPTVLEHLRRASIGTNAMWNEHFGIGVVEYQAAGLICVVHDSGGPREDIVTDLGPGSAGNGGSGATGFRATTEEEFAAAYEAALALPRDEKIAMRLRARQSSLRFTEEEFSRKWIEGVESLLALVPR